MGDTFFKGFFLKVNSPFSSTCTLLHNLNQRFFHLLGHIFKIRGIELGNQDRGFNTWCFQFQLACCSPSFIQS
jgi:hypothetical protein